VTASWHRGFALALLTAVMWGLLPLALKEVLAVMDPVTVSWYRFSLSAVIALAWYGLRRGPQLRALFAPGQRGWSAVAVLGLSGNYLLYIWGLQLTNPGASQVVIQLAPLLLLVCSVVLLDERFSALQWLGVALFAGGMLLFFRLRLAGSAPAGEHYTRGILLVVGAAVVWAAYGLAQKKLLVAHHARDILLLICLGGSLLLLPLAHPMQIFALDARELWLLLFCGINTIVAYGAFGLAMSYWEASRVSAVVPLAPLLTLVFTEGLNRFAGTRIAAEPLDWVGALGAVLVVVGAATAALPRHTRQPPPQEARS